jgi:nickel-dependent lactate racemase
LGAKFVGIDFIVYVIENAHKEIIDAVAGDLEVAHAEGIRKCSSLWTYQLPEKADIIIASPGGYPKDINVYQMQKTMDNARLAVRDGGVIILLGECREGVGSDMYVEWMKKFKTPAAIEEEVRHHFVIGGHKAYAVTRLMNNAEFILISAMADDLVKTLLFTPAHSMEEALSMAFEKLGGKPRICLMPQGSFTVPIE